MILLAAKALLAPLLLAVCTLVARKWGAAMGGWLLGLPLTSGPVSYFLLLEHGPRFAENAARGTLLGIVGTGVFCAGYSLTAEKRRWYESLAFAGIACMAVTFALSRVHLDVLDAVLFSAVFLALMVVAAGAPTRVPAAPAPRKRDLVLRMAVASTVVVGVTVVASTVGSQISGMLTTIPIISAVMAVSTHRSAGGASTRGFLRGTVVGMWGCTAFFAVVGLMVTAETPLVTYVAATVAAAAVALAAGAITSRSRARTLAS